MSVRELPEWVLYAVLGATVQQGLLESVHRRAAEVAEGLEGKVYEEHRICLGLFCPEHWRLRGGLMVYSSHSEQRSSTDFCSLVTESGPEGAAGSCAAGVARLGAGRFLTERVVDMEQTP